MTVVVGCGAGFSGDRTDAAVPLVDALLRYDAPRALMFETLGERTLAAAQLARLQDPDGGDEPLLEAFLSPVLGDCLRNDVTVLGNFGAANPEAARRRVAGLALRAGVHDARVAVIQGDDVREEMHALDWQPWEGERRELPEPNDVIAANVYLGADALVDALSQRAQVVITGRVADPALALAPLRHHHGWSYDDWDRIAAGTLAGHLIECGAQVTGGYFADPGAKDVPGMASLGYPIVEVERDGSLVVTKPPGTGGLVTEQTVKEQLLYEIHDPSAYVTPDVVLDLTGVEVRQVGRDRVSVKGVRGRPAPERLKTTISFLEGYQGEAEISYAGPNALARAKLARDTLRQRLENRCPADMKSRFDLIGISSVFDGDSASWRDIPESLSEDIRLRLAVEHRQRHVVELATQELLALYCCGPAGGGGVRRHHTRRLKTASYLVRREQVKPRVSINHGSGDHA
ncbi:acyclic terpene utilization AtuA family protein [Halomonas alimentaria]|uniref:Acyclic terpene utilization AtuA family protein n=1 Tax=Halomonas alimentaria TaxID=147248 RepID=A0A7X4W512_9GAMM|nr:acyclic terpene utilization AtuA family protein [Halomonas alimentaria]NAW34525.1 acyclic terpene utilization AtuA family protein [Halomonas alimentaria]